MSRTPSKSLTENQWLKREEREQALEKIAQQDPDTSKWLAQLLEREQKLQELGNAYGEKYTARQIGLAVGPIVGREHLRSRLLEAARERPMTLAELTEALQLPRADVLGHVVELKRRNLLFVERMDERTPVYRAAPLQVGES